MHAAFSQKGFALGIGIASCCLLCNLAFCLSLYTVQIMHPFLLFLQIILPNTPLSPDSSHTESLTPWSDLSIWLGVFHRPYAFFFAAVGLDNLITRLLEKFCDRGLVALQG